MKKIFQILILAYFALNIISKEPTSLKDNPINIIDEDIQGTTEYKTKTITFSSTDTMNYFTYDFDSNIPSSNITSFRLEISPYSSVIDSYRVYCTNVLSSASDSDLKNQLDGIINDVSKTTCIHIKQNDGNLDSIMKLDQNKTKIGIAIYMSVNEDTNIKINLRISERILGTSEKIVEFDEKYSLVPVSINISNFWDISNPKILFYSSNNILQMYEAVSNENHPTKLFSGNILSIDTNPDQVILKYNNSNILILLVCPNQSQSNLESSFKFEVIMINSQFLVDYYISSNPEGRSLNSPLLINMTDCRSPHYVILNYNVLENGKTLVIDEIYGKISYLGIATSLEQETWEEMIENDFKEINLNNNKYNLPTSTNNIDIYKLECSLPLMLNFYYIDESDPVYRMNEGDVQILYLKAYQTINVPFFDGLITPEIIIEVNQPENNPNVIITVLEDVLVKENSLNKYVPLSLSNGITIKERGGSSNTRIIIKVGYSTRSWQQVSEYVKYNSENDIYLFEFPNDSINKYFYTFAKLYITGTNADDNVKFCYNANAGAASRPYKENCYYVSKTNSAEIKLYNPLIMFRNYNYDDYLKYLLVFKPDSTIQDFGIQVNMETYDTNIRVYEGINNKIIIGENGQNSSILTPPKIDSNITFLQIQVCGDVNSITTKVLDALNEEEILPEKEINPGEKKYYRTFNNYLMDTKFYAYGNSGTNIFLRMVGLNDFYTPSFAENQKITFDQGTNTLYFDSPLTTNENWQITVLIDEENVIKNKYYTLCNFVNAKFENLAKYNKTKTISNSSQAFIQINFDKAGINVGEKFDAIIYFEQLTNGKMVFLSDLYQGTVGEIHLDPIHQINETYSLDENYLYETIESFDTKYYFSYLPSSSLEVPIGAFRIELDDKTNGEFLGVYCTFVDKDADDMTMIEEIENAINENKSYCIGNKSSLNEKVYNYIFKYEYEEDSTTKKMVIKVVNENNVNGSFTIYMKKDQGEEIEKTGFDAQKEYGQDESSKKSIIPYIIDLEKIRGTDDEYVSKILFFSRYLELQLYYVPTDTNAPIKLFSGNILLLDTKPDLAQQNYHSNVLVLITENLEGPSQTFVEDVFRFHTKMFNSESKIEYFFSQNPEGRTLNIPLSFGTNECSNGNNKLYYILNYNEEEFPRKLYIDMIFGKYQQARIAKEINQDTWNDLINNSSSMVNIEDYSAELPKSSQHIDIIEFTCASPLLLNIYYTKDNYFFVDIEPGDTVIKTIPSESSYSFPLKNYDLPFTLFTISLYNDKETPNISVISKNGDQFNFYGNSLDSGIFFGNPERITIKNYCKSETRFIFKFGFNVETSWQKEDIQDIDGTLYYNQNTYVYKFPLYPNKNDFTSVDITVKSNEDSISKFCFSTNLGIAIDSSNENCFSAGKYIPYTLSFVNPQIIGKNYDCYTDNYYVTIKPFNEIDSLSVEIVENKYSITNRNELGIAKELYIKDGQVSTILTSPSEPMNIFFQLKLCKETSSHITYELKNAFTGEFLKNGKIYFSDAYGIYYISTNIYMENQIDLSGEDINVFVKHSAISNDYNPNINPNYKVSFDSSSNTLMITKPIFNEEFKITIIISKASLEDLSICDVAFSDKELFGDYVMTFNSSENNLITHFVDFSIINYSKGTKFWALVYAEQTKNSKMEFIYPSITGEVGNVSVVNEIDQYIEGETEYLKTNYEVKSSGNYFYYDFENVPLGNVSALKITTDSVKISKVTCIFVSQWSTDESMVSAVNSASLSDINYCLGEKNRYNDSYNALINAKDIYLYAIRPRLVIQILYEFENGEEINENTVVNITIKNGGTDLSNEGQYSSKEPYTAIPYVIDLLKIRGDKPNNYTSKILFYSSTREMQIYYILDDNKKPINLFTGNVLVLNTNEDFIQLNYQGATKLILLSDSLSNIESSIIGEEYKFSISFFNEESNINYFISSNSEGRPLNNQISIEMTSCDKPYYYIMNYNKVEGQRKLYLDTIFGEKKLIRISTQSYYKSWEELIENLQELEGNEVILEEKSRFHFDIIELSCNLPSLFNLYYTDPKNTKITNLEIGDISILSLQVGEEKTLTFKSEAYAPFIYSFIVEKHSVDPYISITFDESDEMEIDKNGFYIKTTLTQYGIITIKNKISSGYSSTRVIFKFGLAIEFYFTKDEKGIYSNEKDIRREYNLYGYIYDTSSSKYNYTGVDFQVTTTQENVKFCYNTNLGAYIFPSLQNCHIIGKDYPYIITTLNPLVMHREYLTDDLLNYYIGFRTMNKEQNLTIIPIPKKYNITTRNFEGIGNTVKIFSENGETSTILTAPKNHEKYIFVETCLCTKKSSVKYKYFNAYNNSYLGIDGQIKDNKVKAESFENTKLDTELKFYNGKIGDEIFIKHSGYDYPSVLSIQKIVINYNRETKILSWTQPIIGEKFEYIIYIDKIGIIKKQQYSLCDIANVKKLPHYRKELITDSQTPNIKINISEPEFWPNFGEFDILIVAEQLEKQKFIFKSATYDSLGNNDDEDEPDDTEEEKSEFEDEEENKGENKEEEKSEYENEEENKNENKEEESEYENEEEYKGESEEKSPYSPGVIDPDNSSDTLKIVLAVTIPVAVIIIALVVFFILRWKRKKSSLTKSQIENLVSQSELV